MTSVKLINHSSSTADWNYLLILLIAHYFEGFNVWMALRTSL